MAIQTIRDVADAAGVSVATASRALSGQRRVSPELVDRVTAAATALGYRRNALARALRSQRSGTIGVVVPEITNPFFPAIIEAVDRRLQESDRQLVVCDSRSDPTVEADRVHSLVGRQVDGLIISPCDAVASRATVRDARQIIPVVQIDRFVDDLDADWIGVDDEAGISAVVRHLIDVGARELAFVGSTLANSSARLRLAAYQRAAADASNASVRRTLLGDFTSAWGYDAIRTFLVRRGVRPDAIVCANDAIAFGVLRGLRENDVKVPENVMVTGFDDIMFAEMWDPPLTTVRQPHEYIAGEAVRLLDERNRLDQRDEEVGRRHIAIAPELVIRATTAMQPSL